MVSLIGELINRRVWAVVGASHDPSKFGNRIYKEMKDAGYKVYGINSKGGAIEGDKLFTGLSDLKNEVEFSDLVVDIVVPPKVTEEIVKDCKALGIKNVWLQPGSESTKAVQFCQDNNIGVIYGGPCAMVEKKDWNRL